MTKARPVITGLIWLSEQLGGDAFRARGDLAFLGGVGFLASLLCVVDCRRSIFLKHDPDLVKSRLRAGPSAEHEKSQKIIKTLTAGWCVLMIAPGIERHFHSSRIPAAIALRGDAIVAVGYQIVFLAFRENR